MVLQGALGFTQYFLHDSAVVVEFHLAGLTALWIAGLGFYLSLHRHVVAVPRPGSAADGDGSARVSTAAAS